MKLTASRGRRYSLRRPKPGGLIRTQELDGAVFVRELTFDLVAIAVANLNLVFHDGAHAICFAVALNKGDCLFESSTLPRRAVKREHANQLNATCDGAVKRGYEGVDLLSIDFPQLLGNKGLLPRGQPLPRRTLRANSASGVSSSKAAFTPAARKASTTVSCGK